MYAVRDDFWISVYAVRDISDLQPNLPFLAGAFQHLCIYFQTLRKQVLQFLYKQLPWPVCDTKQRQLPLPEIQYHLTLKYPQI